MAASGNSSWMQHSGIQTGRAIVESARSPWERSPGWTMEGNWRGRAWFRGNWTTRQLTTSVTQAEAVCSAHSALGWLLKLWAPPTGLSPDSHLQNPFFSSTSGAANSVPLDLHQPPKATPNTYPSQKLYAGPTNKCTLGSVPDLCFNRKGNPKPLFWATCYFSSPHSASCTRLSTKVAETLRDQSPRETRVPLLSPPTGSNGGRWERR